MKSSPPDPDTATLDSSLLARFVRERDEDAFGQLVGRYERVVMGAALRRTGNVEIARDVAQQVFVTLAKKAGSLVGHGCLGGWMYRTASFEALRFMKSERRRRERESAWTGDDEESGQADPAKWEALEEALARMPGAKRDLIVMHYFQDRGYSDMALEMGLTEAATRKRMSRALEELGRLLRRSGATVPAVPLLTGAVAAQSVLTPAPAAAASALETAAATTANPLLSTGTLIATMASTTLFKATTAAVILAALPLGLQWSNARAAEGDLEDARINQMTVASPFDSTADAERRAMLANLRDTRMRLDTVTAELVAARKELDEKKQALEQIETEFVVSHGNPEDLAVRFVPLLKFLASAIREGENGELPPEMEMKAMKMMMGAMPDLKSVLQLDEDPAAKARFVSRLIVDTAGLDEELRQEIEAALVPEMTKAKESGLAFGERPEWESPEYSDWEDRYDRALRLQAMAVEPLLPAEIVDSELWSFFTNETDGGVAELYSSFAEMSGSGLESFRAEPEETQKVDSE